jgi:hypothetical protein
VTTEPTPTPTPTPQPVVKPTPPPAPPERPHPAASRPLYKAWWLWTGVAAVTVAGAVVLGVELSTHASGSSPSLGSFGPGLTLRF